MREFVSIPEQRLKIVTSDKRIVRKLEELSNTRIKINKVVCVEGEDPVSIMKVIDALKAFGRGFSFEDSLQLLKEDYVLEIVSVKEYSKSKKRRLSLRGRVIGFKGLAKSNIERYTNTKIAVYGNTVSIIGKWEDVQKAKKAVEMLLSGKPHAIVYMFLEGRL
jgi:ribosomal RNA assembly protein